MNWRSFSKQNDDTRKKALGDLHGRLREKLKDHERSRGPIQQTLVGEEEIVAVENELGQHRTSPDPQG